MQSEQLPAQSTHTETTANISTGAIRDLVQSQFAPVASAYVTSTTHAHGADLPRLVELAAPTGRERLVDVATGGGHTALAFAPHVGRVVASDLTLPMLHEARKHISNQGMSNVRYCRAAAEALPFAANSVDLVICRVAAHHFADIQAFVDESARVLSPQGRLIVSDHIGLDDPDLDAFMDRFERWRDPSHVRAYSFAEWRSFCQNADLAITYSEDFPWEPYDFTSWTARMRMSEANRTALEQWLLTAESRFRDFFEIISRNERIVSLRGTFGILVAQKQTNKVAT